MYLNNFFLFLSTCFWVIHIIAFLLAVTLPGGSKKTKKPSDPVKKVEETTEQKLKDNWLRKKLWRYIEIFLKIYYVFIYIRSFILKGFIILLMRVYTRAWSQQIIEFLCDLKQTSNESQNNRIKQYYFMKIV